MKVFKASYFENDVTECEASAETKSTFTISGRRVSKHTQYESYFVKRYDAEQWLLSKIIAARKSAEYHLESINEKYNRALEMMGRKD